MATALPPEARRLRADLANLTDLAANDLNVVWRSIDSVDAAKAALNDLLPQLVAVYGAAAASLTADWYDDLRETQGVTGRFRAVVPDVGAAGADALAGYAVGPLYAAEPDWSSALTLAVGGLQRRIANASRDTTTRSSVADPAATGWQRVGSGECAFCSMLLARGAVYTEASADFASHDHCACSAVPAFGGQPIPVKPFKASARNITDADRARVREYLATH